MATYRERLITSSTYYLGNGTGAAALQRHRDRDIGVTASHGSVTLISPRHPAHWPNSEAKGTISKRT